MKENPIDKIVSERLEKFDYLDGTFSEFAQGLLVDIDRLIEEEKTNPTPDEPDTEGTVCRHWKSAEKLCDLGFDKCHECYCYFPRIIPEQREYSRER